jgi:hypothetical protein
MSDTSAPASTPAPAPVPEEKGSLTVTSEMRHAYEGMLEGGIEYRGKWNRTKRWKAYSAAGLANNFTAGLATEDSPTVNIIGARVRSLGPRLALNDPSFEVKAYGQPPTPNSEAANSAMLAMLWEQEGYGAALQRMILDFGAFGPGVGFVGYEKSDDGAILDQKRKLFGIASPEFTEKAAKIAPGLVDRVSSREETAMRYRLRERAFVDRVSPMNLVIDPCASSWDDVTFIARRLFLPKVRAKLMFGDNCPEADSISNVALFGEESATVSSTSAQDGTLAASLPDAVKRVEVWELWDITSRATVYLDSKRRCIKDAAYPWRSPHPGFPVVALLWNEIPDQAWAEGLMADGWTLTAEINEIRKRELEQLRKPWGVMKGRGLTPETKAKIDAGLENNTILELEEMEDLEAINFVGIPQESFMVEDRAKNDLDVVTNTTAYDSGGMPSVKRTATEASYSQSSSDAMTSFRQTQVEKAAAQIAERVLAIVTSCFNEVIPLRIENRDPELIDPETGDTVPVGTLIDFDYKGTDHAGYYKITVTPGSMAANAKATEQQQLMQMLPLVQMVPGFKVKEFVMQILAGYPSIKNASQFFEDQPDVPAAPDESDPNAPVDQSQMPPDPFAQQGAQMPPGLSVDGGSGNMAADLAAATQGAIAPGTGMNGLGGMMNLGPSGQ